MMRLIIPVLAVISTVALVIMTRWLSTSADIAAGTAAMPPLLELHATAAVHELPVQEIDDQAWVYSAQEKH